jgi:hypothetical protein
MEAILREFLRLRAYPGHYKLLELRRRPPMAARSFQRL